MEATNTMTADTMAEQHNSPYKKDLIDKRRKTVIVGCILTLLGWALMMFLPWISLALTVAGLVTSIIGVRIPASPRRDLAITAIIAAAVLLLVYLGFFMLIYVFV